MKDPGGNAAPTTGFQNGGWYSGYQYVNGTFAPQAGMIHPQSSQQGAGQMVSSEVNKQSDAAQGLPSGTIDNYVATQNDNPVNNQGGAGNGGSGGGGGTGGGTGANLGGLGATPTLDLPGLSASLNDKYGITAAENDLTTKAQAYNDQQSKINDNPFLSEADRVGRIQKLTTDYNNDIKTAQDSLAMKKADVQTQLDLQTKQFDINSQASQQALSQFNDLLQSGALAGASGSDIANITRSTGISSSMIQAAINSQNAKNNPSQIIPYDDGTNQGFAVINPKTGAIISKQVIAGSKPTKASSGSSPADNKAEALQQLPQDLANKMTLGTAMSFYQQFGITPQQIYNQYKAVDYYHPTLAQQKADQKKYNVK